MYHENIERHMLCFFFIDVESMPASTVVLLTPMMRSLRRSSWYTRHVYSARENTVIERSRLIHYTLSAFVTRHYLLLDGKLCRSLDDHYLPRNRTISPSLDRLPLCTLRFVYAGEQHLALHVSPPDPSRGDPYGLHLHVLCTYATSGTT